MPIELTPPAPRALVWATDLDVLPIDRTIERRDGHLAVRTPGNPEFYWGNLLLFDQPPPAGVGARWEALFEAEFGDEPRVAHRTFAWDGIEGELGSAVEEFVTRGYQLEQTVGLVARPDWVRSHPRENREVSVRRLDPAAAGLDAELWDQVVELQVAARDEAQFEEAAYRSFSRRRIEEVRTLLRAGRGGWYVALTPDGAAVAGSCGVLVTAARGRFQSVDTAAAHRRRGICSTLVVRAAADAARRFGARHLVIAADPDYHALGLYESLGFRATERVSGVCRPPPPAPTTCSR